jgi:hypothetical protein
LEPQQEYTKEELAADTMMKGALGCVDKHGVLRPEKM